MSFNASSSSLKGSPRRGRDPVPQIRPAGIVGVRDHGVFNVDDRPPTPDNIKAFRKSAATTVGRTIRHHGTRHDSPPDENFRYGKKGDYDITAEECLRPVVVDKMGALAADHAEQRYLSSKREPLGKTPACPYDLPEHLNRNGYGMPTRNSENAKNVIYSCGDREAAELHPAGAQRNRQYNWAKAGIDPTRHRFGVTGEPRREDTSTLIAPRQSETVLLPKLTRDVQTLTHHEVGKSRNLGLGVRTGVDGSAPAAGKMVKTDGANVRLLMSGHGTGDDAAYERSVGQISCRSTTLKKLKEEDKIASIASGTHDPRRTFGAPTVRDDLPRPLFRKVTNSTNYGDDVGAGALIYPNRYIAKGIDEKYFTEEFDLEGMRAVADKCGFGLSDSEVDRVFAACQRDGMASVEAFKDTCYDMGL